MIVLRDGQFFSHLVFHWATIVRDAVAQLKKPGCQGSLEKKSIHKPNCISIFLLESTMINLKLVTVSLWNIYNIL